MEKKYESYTNILFPKFSFYRGVGRVFDLFGRTNSYNISKTPKEADEKAIRSDWLTVGNDIRNAESSLRKKYGSKE